MTKIPASRPTSARLMLATSLFAVPVAMWSLSALAAPSKSSKTTGTRLAALPAAKPASKPAAELPQYLPLATLKKMQKQRENEPFAVLQPTWEGHALKKPMRDLLSGPTFDVPAVLPATTPKRTLNGERLAQAFPRPVAPASPRNFRRPGATVTPRWVRYPLEFQLAGIALGTRAVDKDKFNRIDRYGLFALHGNPTAVVRSVGGGVVSGGGGADAGAAGGAGAAPAAAAGADGGAAAAGATISAGTNVTLQQTPPESAALFPQAQRGGGIPGWALAITVKLDNNHVEWLYNRGTYSMGFVVDRLGFVDAVIVAGITSDIAETQLEDPVHTVRLGDDFRKVAFRYGYPDDIVPLAADPGGTANDTTGAPGGAAAGAAAPAAATIGGADAGAGGAAGAAAAAPATDTNGAFRTFDMRYEQSYNVVFTIRNNRVVRIYIFGDPDFFNAQRRNQLRTKY